MDCGCVRLRLAASRELATNAVAKALRCAGARLYKGRGAVEREFGRLKNEYGLAPLRTRGIDRVRIHADLTMLARLGQALSRARTLQVAA
jgi:hypothetical protein